MILQILILAYIAFKLWDISEDLTEIQERIEVDKGDNNDK
jgi:hypothetical protein